MGYVPLLRFEVDKVVINNEAIRLLTWWEDLEDICDDESKLFEYAKYIYLMVDYASPYVEIVDIKKRAKEVLNHVNLILTEVNQKEVLNALEEYEKILETNGALALINDIHTALDSSREYFKTVDYTKLVESGARKGTPLHNPKDLIAIVQKIGPTMKSLIESRSLIIEEVNRKQEEDKRKSKSRGDRQAGFMSRNLNK